MMAIIVSSAVFSILAYTEWVMRNLATMRVFVGAEGRGGNAATIVLDARGMSDEEMRTLAAEKGYECGFVEQTAPSEFSMRFFVPEHEMEMCGHATVGALWALRREGLWTEDTARVSTKSGLV